MTETNKQRLNEYKSPVGKRLSNMPGSERLKKRYKKELFQEIVQDPTYQGLKEKYLQDKQIINKIKASPNYQTWGSEIKIEDYLGEEEVLGKKIYKIRLKSHSIILIEKESLTPLKIKGTDEFISEIQEYDEIIGGTKYIRVTTSKHNTRTIHADTLEPMRLKGIDEEVRSIDTKYGKREIGGKKYYQIRTTKDKELWINEETLEPLRVRGSDGNFVRKINDDSIREFGEKNKQIVIETEDYYGEFYINITTGEPLKIKGTDNFITKFWGDTTSVNKKEFVFVSERTTNKHIDKKGIWVNTETLEPANKVESTILKAKNPLSFL